MSQGEATWAAALRTPFLGSQAALQRLVRGVSPLMISAPAERVFTEQSPHGSLGPGFYSRGLPMSADFFDYTGLVGLLDSNKEEDHDAIETT